MDDHRRQPQNQVWPNAGETRHAPAAGHWPQHRVASILQLRDWQRQHSWMDDAAAATSARSAPSGSDFLLKEESTPREIRISRNFTRPEASRARLSHSMQMHTTTPVFISTVVVRMIPVTDSAHVARCGASALVLDRNAWHGVVLEHEAAMRSRSSRRRPGRSRRRLTPPRSSASRHSSAI